MSKKLERLLTSKADIDKKIAAERTRLLKIKLPRLLKGFETIGGYDNECWARCIRSMINTPDDVNIIGIYPRRKLEKFCEEHNIPLCYDWEVREFQSNLITRIYLRPY